MSRLAELPTRQARLYLQDCRVGLQALSPGSIDVVVTSPPYNINAPYSSYVDRLPEPEFIEWLGDVLGDVKNALSASGSLFLNLGGPPGDAGKPLRVLCGANQGLFVVQNVIHWVKAVSAGDEPVRGHVKPCNSERYLTNQHEYLFHLTHRGTVQLDKLAVGVPFADKANLKRGGRGRNGDRRDRGNTWFIPYRTIQKQATDRPHPATFPEELAERCLRLHGLERIRLVCDPFMGLGTVGRVCQWLGLEFLGYEIDPEYFRYAQEALAAVT